MQGNVDLLIQAAEQSNGRFEVNEETTKLRNVPSDADDEATETEETSKPDEKVLDYWRQQNTRSIYAVSQCFTYTFIWDTHDENRKDSRNHSINPAILH